MATSTTTALAERITRELEAQRGPTKRLANGELVFRCFFPEQHQNGDAHVSARWNERKSAWHCDVCGAGGGAKDIARRLGVEAEKRKAVRETTYQVVDADGRLVAERVRQDFDDGSKSFFWRRDDEMGLVGLKVADLPLYGLPALLAAPPDATVIVVEGEKAADALRQRGILAVGTYGTGAVPSPDALRPLFGHDVVLWPDNDDTGHRHMIEIAARLARLGQGCRIIDWRDAPLKGDAADYFADGSTAEGLVALVEAAKPWEPTTAGKAPTSGAGAGRLVRLADVAPQSVSWLWKHYIPAGKLTLIEGDPGVGKSWITLAIAMAVSVGKGLPGMLPTDPAAVLILTAEDGLGDTVRPRLDAMGADVSLIFAVKGPLVLDATGLAEIEQHIAAVRPALVIIDPLVAYLGGKLDLYRANETREVMAALADMAEHRDCAIIVIRHLTKGSTTKAIYRGLGSIDMTAACRSVLLAGCGPEDPEKRAIVQIKNNLAPMGEALGYVLRDGGFFWTGASDLTAAAMLAAESEDGGSALGAAVTFLESALGDGLVAAQVVSKEAKTLGIAERTLARARAALGVVAQRQSKPGGKRGAGQWFWALPDVQEGQNVQECQETYTENLASLNEDGSLEREPPDWAKQSPLVREVVRLGATIEDWEGKL